MPIFVPESFEDMMQLVFAVGATIAFVWGAYVWRQDRKVQIENKRIEATKPFLAAQLELYLQITRVCSSLVTHFDENDPSLFKRHPDYHKFWQLYWGELALVENKDVESVMCLFGETLNSEHISKQQLEILSLRIAHACRYSLDRSWNIKAWGNPDIATSDV